MFLFQGLGFFDGIIEGSDIGEGSFGKLVSFAIENPSEGRDGVFDLDELSIEAVEFGSDEERLGKEVTDTSCTVDGELVLFGELIHTKDGDDILKILVSLEDGLDLSCDFVVFLTDDIRIKEVGRGGKRIDGRIETQGCDGTIQDGLCIEMGEGGCRSRIGQIVGRDIDSLDGGDGPVLGGSDTFLELTHFGSQGWLITDGGRHTSQKGGDFTSGLGETIDVVDEEKDVLMLDITEVFGHGQSGKTDSHTDARRLVHLTEDEGSVGKNTGLLHFIVKVISFPGAFADTGKDGNTMLFGGDVMHQFLNQDSLSDTGTSEETDLAALDVRAKQIDDLDSGFEDLGFGGLILEFRRIVVDGMGLFGLEFTLFINRLSENVEHSSKDFLADRNLDR